MIEDKEYAGDLHWLELEEPIGIVLIVEPDWYIIQGCQIQKHQMNTECLFMHVRIVQMTLKNQKCFQLNVIK